MIPRLSAAGFPDGGSALLSVGCRRLLVNRIFNQSGTILWKFLLLVFIVGLGATIYIPMKQRKLEEEQMLVTRMHLVDIYLAEKFFFEGRQYYTSDPDSLLSYINNVRAMKIDTATNPIGLMNAYALGDTVRETDLWKIIDPRQRIRRFYVSPVDSSDYMLIVKNEGISITVKDRHGIGRIEDGEASWLQGRKGD
jgi:hypothetical protein